MILFIAWKNIWRNKARSIVIMSAITIGLFGGIFSYAFMMGGMLQRVDNAIKNETSSLQLHNPAFLLNADINNNIAHPELYLKELNQINEIKGTSDRLKSTAMISTSYASSGVVLNGVFPDKERQVTKLFETMMEGEYLKSEDQIPIVIGRKLAKKLNLKLKESTFTINKLKHADEVFITGTTVEITPVIRIDGIPVRNGKPGLLTRKLQFLFEQTFV